MTTDEKLDLLLDKVIALDDKVNILTDKVVSLENKFASLENRVASLENKFASLENRVNSLEAEVKHNTFVVENTVEKCVQVVGEGVTLNAERFDSVDFHAIKRNYEVAVLYAQTVKEQVDSLAKKIEKIA